MEARLAPGSFYGEVIRSQRVAGFTLAESVYEPETRLPAHGHDCAFFYLVLEGASTETYGRRTRAGVASTLVFHPAGETHANHWHGSGGRCFHIELAAGTLERLRCYSRAMDDPAEFHGGPPVWLATRLYDEFRRMDDLAPLAMEALALEIAVVSARPPAMAESRAPRWLEDARDLLHARFSDSLSLAEIAAAAGVHPAHLARAFRRHYRVSVGEYLRRLRIDFACRQIASTEAPLVEIALAAGFTDQSHFCKTFKQLVGVPPTLFLRQRGGGKRDARR
jgi:AraC family transcriptional regulator